MTHCSREWSVPRNIPVWTKSRSTTQASIKILSNKLQSSFLSQLRSYTVWQVVYNNAHYNAHAGHWIKYSIFRLWILNYQTSCMSLHRFFKPCFLHHSSINATKWIIIWTDAWQLCIGWGFEAVTQDKKFTGHFWCDSLSGQWEWKGRPSFTCSNTGCTWWITF